MRTRPRDDSYFGSQRPARYGVRIDDGAAPKRLITVWAKSPGQALDTAMEWVDAQQHVNVRGSQAHVEELGREPNTDADLRATDEGWSEALPADDDEDRVGTTVDRVVLLSVAAIPFALGVLATLLLVWLF